MKILDNRLTRQEVMEKIALSLTILSLREKYEEILFVLGELKVGEIHGVNAYLARYFYDIDANNENTFVRDKMELLNMMGTVSNGANQMKPSFSASKLMQNEYLRRMRLEFDRISSP